MQGSGAAAAGVREDCLADADADFDPAGAGTAGRFDEDLTPTWAAPCVSALGRGRARTDSVDDRGVTSWARPPMRGADVAEGFAGVWLAGRRMGDGL